MGASTSRDSADETEEELSNVQHTVTEDSSSIATGQHQPPPPNSNAGPSILRNKYSKKAMNGRAEGEKFEESAEVRHLLGYLRNVADHSSALPKTQRDDPDLGRIVSTITAEEYNAKAAAFVPADVRVIGGVFMRYPKVWNLPTSDEFVLSDGAQEPGMSYGGACCNALLKVLYESATSNLALKYSKSSEFNDPNKFINPDDLFDDDDDDGDMEGGTDEYNGLVTPKSFDQSALVNTFTSISALSWAEVLQSMKCVMADMEFVQVCMLFL